MQLISSTAGIAMTAATVLTLAPAASATRESGESPTATGRSTSVPQSASSSAEPFRTRSLTSACPPAAPMPRRAQVLDGFRIGWLPAGLGTAVSDFAYEWDGVSFTSRVWETGSDTDGWQVDLQVTVMRGDSLSDPAAMHAYLAEYHERDPATWARQKFDHLGDPGFRAKAALFWLVEPGVAVWVHLDGDRFSDQALVRTACGVTTSPARGSG